MIEEFTNKQRGLLQDEENIEFIRRAKEALRPLLLSKPNVIALGIGLRRRNGKLVDEVCIKVYVSSKVPPEYLSEEQRLPESLEFESKAIGVDVETAEIPKPQAFTRRNRPLIGGSSVGVWANGETFGSGTIGCCITLDDGQTYILGNNHVLTRLGRLPAGAFVLQPSAPDGGVYPDDIVAIPALSVPINFGTTTVTILGQTFTLPNSNFVDCALAVTVDAFNTANREIYWLGYPAFRTKEFEKGIFGNPTLADLLRIFQPVHKMGRSTEYTVGWVRDIDWDGYVDYSEFFDNPPGTNQAWFNNQLQIYQLSGTWASDGDSGSLVLDAETNRPVGLHFAGTETYGIANPIQRVMEALNIPRI